MVRATYQTRLSAIILGIRPSAAHLYGSTGRAPADNLTHLGHEAWRVGLGQLQADLTTDRDATAGEQWIERWIATELERDDRRWSDVSTTLELLAISLGPAIGTPSDEPRGRRFWSQWHRNIAHLGQQVEVGVAAPAADTASLLEHCIQLVDDHRGPEAVLEGLALVGSRMGPTADGAPFRPLASAVERLQLSVILASTYDTNPPCTAAMARLLELRPPTVPCGADASRRRRLKGARYRAASPGD